MAYFIPVVIALATISPSSDDLSIPWSCRTGVSPASSMPTALRASSSTRCDLTEPLGALLASNFPEWSSTQPMYYKDLLSHGEDFSQWETEHGEASTDKWLLFPPPKVVFRCGGSMWLLWGCPVSNPIEHPCEDGASSAKHHLVSVLATSLLITPVNLHSCFLPNKASARMICLRLVLCSRRSGLGKGCDQRTVYLKFKLWWDSGYCNERCRT